MRRNILFVSCLLASVSQGFAAEATHDGAQRLVDVFHKYLGMPRAGEADFVRAEPAGETYRLSIALNQLARPFEPLGFKIDPAEISFVVKPLADGTWQVSDLLFPSPLTMHIKNATTTTRVDGLHFDGIYDPALASFVQLNETFTATDSQTSGPNAEGASHSGEQTVQSTASAAGDGAVNVAMQQTLRDIVTRQSITPPHTDSASPLPPTFDLSYGVDSGTSGWTFNALEGSKLLDLWAYAVARAQESPPTLENQEIKKRLTDLLPIYQRIEEKTALKGLRVETPFGAFGVEDLSGGGALTGIVSSSELQLSMKLAGLSYPEDVAPPWTKQLVPTDLEFGIDLSGFQPRRARPAAHREARRQPQADARAGRHRDRRGPRHAGRRSQVHAHAGPHQQPASQS